MLSLSMIASKWRFWKKAFLRPRTPTVIQMETVECGAASLGIILGYYKRFVPLEQLRTVCGVSRDGSTAEDIVKAAQSYGLDAKGLEIPIDGFSDVHFPCILFWNFNHFLVAECITPEHIYLNDPAAGPRRVSWEEFNQSYTGITLEFSPGENFKAGGKKQSLFDFLAIRLKNSKKAVAFVILASLASVIPGLAIPIFGQIFVDYYLIAHRSDWIAPLLMGMALTALLRAVITSLQQTYLLRLQTRLAISGSAQFFWHLLRLPVEFFNQRFAGDLSQRVSANDRIADLLSGGLATNVVNLITMIFYAILMFIYDVEMTLISIFLVSLNVLAIKKLSRLRIDNSMKLAQDYGKLVATTVGGIQNIETIKATGSENNFFIRWSGFKANVNNTYQYLQYHTLILGVVPVLLNGLITVAILGLGAFRIIDGTMTVGMLVAFQGLVVGFTSPVTNLMSLMNRLQQAKADLVRVDDIYHYELDEVFTDTTTVSVTNTNQLDGSLVLKDITFGYSPKDPPLLENFHLSIPLGKRVAIVGTSGSGKSTIRKLITGLYQPWSGDILIGGISKDAFPKDILHGYLASVDQEIYLFEGSVRDNLTLWDSTISQQDLVRASKDAALHEIIVLRSKGYDEPVLEGGRNFSGGQLQRIEIARALALNPQILVMDEATASLDPLTEKYIDDQIRQRGCTCLIIAHRLSTIRDCDEIIVMSYGKVMERGTHDELMGLKGAYFRLIEAQIP